MSLYQYQTLSKEGKTQTAQIDAMSLQDAKQKLIRDQVVILKINPISEKELKSPLSKKEVLSITRELSRLLQAGLPLYEALSALEEKYTSQKHHKILLDLCSQVKGGHPLSKALSRHPNTFDILYVSMVANAEKMGRLAPSLIEIAKLLDRQLHIRKAVISALLYPMILFAFSFVVLSSLLFFVVPSLQELFDGRQLHPFTRIVFAASNVACNSKIFLITALGGFALTAFAAATSKTCKARILSVCMRLPILKHLFVKVAFVRFSRAAATLLEGGLPLITAFSQARTVMRHPVLEKVIERAEAKLTQGERLSIPFTGHPLIPPLVPRMLAIAEQSGKLSFTMHQISEIYEDELQTTLDHFATLAQPILLLLLGGLVGFILLSVLLPLTDVSSFTN